MIHKVENGLELSFLDAFQVEQWIFPVRVVGKNPPEEGRARGQYHFVSSDLNSQSRFDHFCNLNQHNFWR